MGGGGEHVSGTGGGVGPDPRDVALHGDPGDATPEPEAEAVAKLSPAEIGRIARQAGITLRPGDAALLAAMIRLVRDVHGPPYPVGTVLVPPDPRDPRVFVVADDDDHTPIFEVDPREAETFGWAMAHHLPERPVVLRRGPETVR